MGIRRWHGYWTWHSPAHHRNLRSVLQVSAWQLVVRDVHSWNDCHCHLCDFDLHSNRLVQDSNESGERHYYILVAHLFHFSDCDAVCIALDQPTPIALDIIVY